MHKDQTYTSSTDDHTIVSSKYQTNTKDGEAYAIFTGRQRLKPCKGMCGRCDCYG